MNLDSHCFLFRTIYFLCILRSKLKLSTIVYDHEYKNDDLISRKTTSKKDPYECLSQLDNSENS